ncbi:SusC/RagA family TonB-linked outer membrane protein [Halalkalibaculum sp. DA3122]|uniref:SusC/RagA family TonB-linked outer membrane protein n=1 Tax=Halalkalibaculum sp. DA3122 TaxID=3373607 RepID=UPI003754378C
MNFRSHNKGKAFLWMLSMVLVLSISNSSRAWSQSASGVESENEGQEVAKAFFGNADLQESNSSIVNKVVSLQMENVQLLDALKQVAGEHSLRLTYSKEVLPLNKTVTVNLKQVTFNKLMYTLLEGTGLKYAISDRGNLVLFKSQQQHGEVPNLETVSGTVTDAQTGETLPSVNVALKGTTTGTTTDVDGAYSLNVPSLNDTLVFSFVGYQTAEVPINGRTSIDVGLSPEAIQGEDVVVVGYGTQSTRQLSSSVSNVSSEDLGDQPVGQLTQKLQGKVSGAQISQTTGIPGQGMDIRIRGAASLTAGNDPLYVVDGNPIVGDISNINPNDIESISVLKDASASALYGSRASNGVVLIETKEAVPGETRVDYNAYTGLQQVPQRGRPDMMNAREFATFKKEIAEFRGQSVDPVYQNPEEYGEGTDWYDAITEVAPVHDHTLTLSTGTETFSTTASAGFFKQDGVIVGSGYERYSLRINSRYQPHEDLSIGLNIAPTRSENSNSNSTDGLGAVINENLQTSPIAPLRNPDGSLTLTAFSPGMFPTPNYVRTQKDRVVDNRNTQILANLFAEYEIVDGLSAKVSGNIDKGDYRNFTFNPTTTGARGVGLYDTPFSSLYQGSYLSWVNENTLEYQSEIGNHNFDILAGFTAQKFRQDASSIQADNYPDNKVQTIGAAGTVSSSSSVDEWTLLSYLARVNYSYDEKYLLTASIRRDGSSRFGEENRWGNFPSLSLGWVISEEDFMPETETLSFLKLRAGIGVTGNFSIGNYTHIPTISSANYVFGSSIASGRSVDNLADNGLGWESNRQFNLGLDMYFLNDRIQLQYDYYQKLTSDLLFNVEVPEASGFSNIQTNIGELNFWGHEIAVNSTNIQNSDFSWTTDFNISFDRNEVESLGNRTSSLITGPGSGLIGGSHITKEGEPVGMLYGMIHEGVYVNQEEFDNSPKHSTSQVGTVKFRDTNGDGVITVDDATVIGNPHPDFVFGMTNNLNYKNFDFSVSVSGTYGNDVLRGAEQTLTNLDGVFNVLSNVQDRWRSPENPGSGRYGSVASGTTYLERDWWGTQFMYDASHISINNITLGYSIPTGQSDFLRRFRVYGSVQQVHIFTSYPGANPQVSQSQASTGLGIDGGSYPVPRTYTLGVNIGF